MKLIDMQNPVRAVWLADQGFRLDPSPYLSGAFEARKLLERLPRTEPLISLTTGHSGGIYNGPKFRRNYVSDPEHGVPFLGSTDMMEADFSTLPLLSKNDAESMKLSHLRVEPDMTLISCSGTVGRMCYARSDMKGIWASQDILKVVADRAKILPGYLFAFIYSKYGIPIVTGQASGSMIRHLEPGHIADLPVPRLGDEVETRIHDLIQEAADLRGRFQIGVGAATKDLFVSADLSDLLDFSWYKEPRSIGAATWGVDSKSLRALNYDSRATKLRRQIESVPHRTLGEVCKAGELRRGNRFTRVAAEEGHGYRLMGQEQLFWLRPEDKWIALPSAKASELRARAETIFVAARGLLTDRALIGRAAFLPESWRERYVFSEDLLRVTSGDPDFPGAYLFAYLRSEVSFRIMRSLCAGTGPQDINSVLRLRVPVPECTPADRHRIAETVRQAYRDRDEADALEDRALALLDEAVREEAR
ncbi:type I restriction enzyme, S subunit [Glycomyces sambucus]|uniref:Type I restriction enzyme, S subunit n=1 Tax=Glycomyces sambucus TaxID=380244 RepID=A0A1G9MYK2_9ACTN|nr:restriction endonuclease subunit S [Glycomyces sambucus]SDL79370.1 type I restriction enzyme, S subunit [Glycomyces sambucus]